MSTDLFRNQPGDFDVQSEAGEPVTTGTGKDHSYGGANVIRDTAGKALRGRGPVSPDPRKYKYDTLRAKGAQIRFVVGRDDRLSAEDAGNMLDRIHRVFGIAAENEDVLASFDEALWVSHTVNGGSTLAPGRAKFCVPGVTQEFDYKKVVDKLGVEQRRFFRAFADDITNANKRVIRNYDPYDPVSQEQWGWIQQVAHERGLHRFPHLAHDSADACLLLTTVERSALAESKKLVISTSNNSADRLRANNRVQSADSYDSTTGTNLA